MKLRLRLFPGQQQQDAARTAHNPHDVRASLATVRALGCGAFGHVRIWTADRPSVVLPARLMPWSALSDERERGVLLAADEGVLAALGVAAVGERVEVEAVLDPATTEEACTVTVAPFHGSSTLPPAMTPSVLNRAARGLLLVPGALLLVPCLGRTYAMPVVEVDGAAEGGDAGLVGPGTEVRVRARDLDNDEGREPAEEEGEGAPGIHEDVLEEALALLRASSEAAVATADPAMSCMKALRMRGLLLSGPRGAGKTQLLRRLVRRLRREGLRAAYVRGKEVRGLLFARGEEGYGGESGGGSERQRWQQLWGAAARASEGGDGSGPSPPPTVLLLDDADSLLLGGEEGHGNGAAEDEEDDQSGRGGRDPAMRALLRLLTADDDDGGGPCCWILATRGSMTGQGGGAGTGASGGRLLARRLAALQGVGLFDRALELPPLTGEERATVLRALLLPKKREREETVRRVAEATGGFLPGDLERLCTAARFHALARMQQEEEAPEPSLCWADFVEARGEVGPAALRGLLQATRFRLLPGAGASWASVGGYEGVKARLRQLIEWPLKYAATFQRMGLSSVAEGPGASYSHIPGILLHGPSGCGKSLLARVLAAEAKANFVELPATEVFSPFLGDSEARLRDAFARARCASPCILFLDELDAMAAGREGMTTSGSGGGGSSSSSGGVYARVLSTLLNEMDGVSTEAGGGGLVVLAATNRVGAVDAALLRPGRLQEALLVPLPRPEHDYLPILQVACARMPLAIDVDLAALVRERLAPLATALNGGQAAITPALLGALAREAALVCLRERVAGEEGEERELDVTAKHFDQAVENVFCGM